MRIYQTRRHNKDLLPHNVYMQMFYKLRDLPRLRAALHTETDAHRLSCIRQTLAAVDEACQEMRSELGVRVYDGFHALKAYDSYDYFNYMFKRFNEEDEGPCKRTWSSYKSRLLKKIAEKLNIF